MGTPLAFSMSDIYPSYNNEDTSDKALPDSDDMAALAENQSDVSEAREGARPKNILFAAVILIAAIVLLGGAD